MNRSTRPWHMRLGVILAISVGLAASSPAVEATAAPKLKATITGAKAVGSKLMVAVAGSQVTSYTWFRNGKRIAKTTTKTYTVKKKDAGRTLRVKVTTRSGSVIVSKKVRIGKILVAKKVSVTGTPSVGRTLSVATSNWKPRPASFTYRWSRDGVTIPGANRSKYTLTAADAGTSVTITVTGTKAGYTAASRVSGVLAVAAPASTGGDGPAQTGQQTEGSTDAATATTPSAVASGTVLSGASGNGTGDGTFDAWRGTPLQITSTWSDDNANMVQFWQLQKGGSYANWNKPIDVAIGAISWSENWASAASGAYDARWIASLKKLRELRISKSGTTYIRFAHEMNGNWYPWSVNIGNYTSFVSAWKHFRALQTQYYPEAKLVFNLNRESVGTGMDWRKFFPGAAYVDVVGVDYYNHWPYVSTAKQWNDSVNATDGYGAPKGLARYAEFAKSVGLPLSISEWATTASNGDSPAFVEQMYAFTRANAGSGPGQVVYEVYFNVIRDNNEWHLFGAGSRMPNAALTYQKLF